MSNIFATRRGFLYQDRFAVLQFLKYFQSKEIVEFYIDYTFDQSCRRSVDVIIVLTNGIKFIFEVKSGQDFKHDKRKKDSSEVRDAFNQFLEYTAAKGPSNMSFVMTPELRGKVTQYWQYLTELQDTPSFRSPNARHPVKWLFQKLNINYFTSHKMLYDFVKNLTITCGDSDIPDNTNDQHSPIDDLVSQKIRDLSFDFRANTTEPELPCEMLYHQMLFLCQKYAGTNRNICELLTDLILKFFSQRQMINRTASGDFHNIFEGTKRFYTTWRTQLSAVTPITPEVSVAIVSEGGVIHE
jgi:hypothetical protein